MSSVSVSDSTEISNVVHKEAGKSKLSARGGAVQQVKLHLNFKNLCSHIIKQLWKLQTCDFGPGQFLHISQYASITI